MRAAHPVGEHAELLRDVLAELHPDAPVTVVGAGLTAVETASELAEQGRRVNLVCGGELGPSLSKPGRRSMATWLRRLGVDVLETAGADAVALADGTVLPSAVTVWTAGFAPTHWAGCSPMRR